MDKTYEFFNQPRKVVYLAAGLGVFFTLFYALFNIDVPHDVANCYAYMAREFSRGNWNRAYYPGLPPLQTTLGGILCFLKVPAFSAMQLVSGMFFTLTVLPLYEFLKRFFSRKAAAWGALFFILTPPLIKVGCSGMPDSARTFFVMLSLTLVFNYLDNPARKKKLWGIGFAFAGLSMSRGEGLAVACFLGAVMIILYWRRCEFSLDFKHLKDIVLTAVSVMAISLLFLSPRMYQNYVQVGYAVPDHRVAMALHAQFEDWSNGHDGDEMFQGGPKAAALGEAKEMMIATEPSVEEEISGSLSRVLTDSLKGGYWIYLFLSFIGAVFLLNKRRWRTEYNVLLLLIMFNSGLFYFIVSSPRYYTVNVPLLMVFTVNGFMVCKHFMAKRGYFWLLLAIMTVLAVSQAYDGLKPAISRDKADQRAAGKWIMAHKDLFRPGVKRLRMYQSTQSQICFWSDSDPVHKDLGPMLNPVTFRKFDIAVFSPANTVWLEIMRKRSDVEEVMENPYKNIAVMFRKKPKPVNS